MDKKKIFCIALAIIIILGILITCIWGFNVDIIYREHKQVDIFIGKEFNNKEIKQLAQEVLENKDVYVEKVELYEDMVSINAKYISNEQLEQLNQKINEKYEIENKVEEISIVTVPKVKLSDKIKPYIWPAVICAIIILAYTIIRFRKLGILKIILKVLSINVLAQAIYFSIFAITRIPINILTLPGALILLVIVIYMVFYKLETKKEKKEIENQKNKK